MAKKKAEPTFRDLLAEAEEYIVWLRAKYDNFKFVAHLAWEGFAPSYRIALERGYYTMFGTDLARVLTLYRAYTSLEGLDAFWAQWPAKTTVFGQYQFHGTSALAVALRFTESINNTALIARVTEFNSFDSDGFRQPELSRWASALAKELDSALCFAIWPKGIMRRDYEVFARLADEELLLAGRSLAAIQPAEMEDPKPTITTSELKTFLVQRAKDTTLTQWEVTKRQLNRLAKEENWPTIGTSKNPKRYCRAFVKNYMHDKHRIDIGPHPKIRPE